MVGNINYAIENIEEYFSPEKKLYCFHHSKIKFISSRQRVIFSLYIMSGVNFIFIEFYVVKIDGSEVKAGICKEVFM